MASYAATHEEMARWITSTARMIITARYRHTRSSPSHCQEIDIVTSVLQPRLHEMKKKTIERTYIIVTYNRSVVRATEKGEVQAPSRCRANNNTVRWYYTHSITVICERKDNGIGDMGWWAISTVRMIIGPRYHHIRRSPSYCQGTGTSASVLSIFWRKKKQIQSS